MPKIGIVLSGGFAKGAYQIGILKALTEFFDKDQISCVSASSIGAVNAYAFMAGKIDDVEQMWLNLDIDSFGKFVSKYVKSTYITDTIGEIVGESGAPQSDMYITCFNFSKMKLNYINLKDIGKDDVKAYLRASVTMPMFSHAVDIGGMRYVDGGLIDNVPVKPLMNQDIDYAIVIHFDNHNYIFENHHFNNKLIKINFLDEKFIKNSLTFDKESISYMLRTGYEESMALLDIIFKNGIDDLEYIYHKIGFVDSLRGNKKFRLTGDVVVGNINRVLKKVVGYKL